MHLRFFVIFMAVAAACFGQEETAFRIITHSEGVMVGNQPARQGMNVSLSKEQLIIPDKGYAGVLTNDGRVYKIARTTRVSDVGRVVSVDLGERKIIESSGKKDFAGVGFPLAPQGTRLAGITRDSVFIFWGWKKINSWTLLPRKGGYTVKLTTLFADPLQEITTDKNWIVVNVSQYKTAEDAIVYSMKGDYEWGKIQDGLIKFVPEESSDRAREELQHYLSDADKDFYEFMIYDLNELRYDVSLTLYKIVRDKRKPADPLLQKYLEWLTERYSLDIIKLD